MSLALFCLDCVWKSYINAAYKMMYHLKENYWSYNMPFYFSSLYTKLKQIILIFIIRFEGLFFLFFPISPFQLPHSRTFPTNLYLFCFRYSCLQVIWKLYVFDKVFYCLLSGLSHIHKVICNKTKFIPRSFCGLRKAWRHSPYLFVSFLGSSEIHGVDWMKIGWKF